LFVLDLDRSFLCTLSNTFSLIICFSIGACIAGGGAGGGGGGGTCDDELDIGSSFACVRIADLPCGSFFFVSFLTPFRIVAGSGIDGVGGIVGWSGTLRGGAGIYC
jgi:hypothetical protein